MMIRNILILLKCILLFPYTILYIKCGEKDELQKDICKLCHKYEKMPIYFRFLYLMANDSYFHELVQYRCRNTKLRYLFWFKYRYFTIPLDVKIGGGLSYSHPYSTILNAKKIGENFSVKNNVTIGNKNDDENMRPVIGDNVYVGVGAIIIGDVTIGNNVIIGAGSVVVKDIPNDSVVVGNPARIIYAKK